MTVWGETKSRSATSRFVRPFGDELGDCELRRGHCRPAVRLGFGGDQTPPHAEFAEAAADATGVPGRAELRVESERTIEGVDGGFAVGRDQVNAQVFECGRQLEPAWCALEEIDRLEKIRGASRNQTADLGRRCRDGGDARVQLGSPLAVGERKLRELVVACGESDPSEQHLVGYVERESREDRSAVRFGRSADPASCRFGVAFGQREEREQPARMAPHRGRASFEHDLGDVGEAASLARVACVDRQSTERDDAGGVEHCGRMCSVFECVASLEYRDALR